MKLTDEQRAAFKAVVIGTSDAEFERDPLGAMERLFAAGIAHAQAWRPIASAPKDGRIVLVGYFNSKKQWREVTARYYENGQLENKARYRICDSLFEPAGWYECCAAMRGIYQIDHEPTHWLHLPPAPEEGK